MALTPEQQAAYDEAVSNSLSQINGAQQAQTTAPVSTPASQPAPVVRASKTSAIAPPVSSNMPTGVNGGVSANDMSQAMQNVTGAVTQGQGAMAPNMPFPEAKSPNSDMYSLAAPYVAGAGGLLAALYGGKKALESFGKKGEEAPKVEPTMEGQESHEEYMKRMDREERLHEIRLAKAKADEAEAKIQAAKGGPASTQAVAEEPKVDLLAEIEKKHPHIAKAIKEGRVSIADETAAATQQTEPFESKQGIAAEAPKEQKPIQAAVKPVEAPTTATEAPKTAAIENKNVSTEKTTLPEKQVSKGAAIPPATSTTPTVSLPEEWAKVNKGKGMTWLTSSMGPTGAQDFIDRYNNGKPFESHQQMMDRFGEVVSKPSFSDIPKDVRKARGIETKQSGFKIVPGSKPPVGEGGFATPETLGGIGAGLLGAIDIAHTVKQANQAYKNGDYELAQAHANEIRNLHPLGLLYNQLFTKTPEDIEMMRKQSVFEKPEVKSSITRQVTSPRK